MPRLIARWNPARDVWETPTTGLFCEHSDVYSATWPASGTTRGGVAYEQPTSAHRIPDSGSSSSPPKVITDAYMAGIMDGEGCIRIVRQKRGTFSVQVELTMSYKALPMLQAIHRTYGGSLITMKRDDRSATRAQCWSWRITSAKSIDFLRRMLPHLIIKKPHALLAIRFHETVKPMQRGPGRGAPWSEMQKALGEAAFRQMKEMNRVGPERPTAPPTLLPTPRTSDTNGTGTHGTGGPDLRTAVELLPTPTSRDWKDGACAEADVPDNALLGRVALNLLPTPRATDGTNGGPNQRGSSGDLMLPSAVQLLPTPVVTDATGTRNRTAGRSPGAKRHAVGTTLTDALCGESMNRRFADGNES